MTNNLASGFAQVIPQSVCTHYGLWVSAKMAPVVHVLLWTLVSPNLCSGLVVICELTLFDSWFPETGNHCMANCCQETRTLVTFFPYSLTMDALLFLSLTTFPFRILPNRLYSPPPGPHVHYD